jgi:hypothetical protein
MTHDATPTARGERIVGFSVLLENRVGRLLDLVRTLDAAGIHMLGLSLREAAEFSMVRFVPDDPEGLRRVLRESGLRFTESALIVVEISGPPDLKGVLAAVLQAECNIDYTFPLLARHSGKFLLALHTEEEEFAASALNAAGFRVVARGDICR